MVIIKDDVVVVLEYVYLVNILVDVLFEYGEKIMFNVVLEIIWYYFK